MTHPVHDWLIEVGKLRFDDLGLGTTCVGKISRTHAVLAQGAGHPWFQDGSVHEILIVIHANSGLGLT
ncbi:hypothetical protein Bpfe_029071 [Biomphalaria pfeifferi]|uniref:Uncharacterized protein n=1 Tax=Biomphalaria pfeifferi TaxID=112525 RepID=A0AAD8EW04_BIOPF|nr:hypothetical protein Bpfe_029071 [Biomphalaria pfeifferi]